MAEVAKGGETVVLSTEVTEALPTVPTSTKTAATKSAATKSAATKSAATKASPIETAAVEFPSSLVRRRPLRALLPATLAVLLAAPLLAAAHQARPAPYGDRLTDHTLHAASPSPS